MKLLSEEEDLLLCKFLDEISKEVLSYSLNSASDLTKAGVNPSDSTDELALGLAQVVLDKTIELTKNKDREEIIRLLSTVALGNVITTMRHHPEFRQRIMLMLAMNKF